MALVNIIAVVILCLSFAGGFKEGAVKQSFNLLALFIAIPLAGSLYYLLAFVLAFLPGTDWENFLGFFITMGLVSAIIHLIFFLPRRIVQAIWKKGLFFRLLGGALNVFNACISFVVFTLVLTTYPIFDWLARAFTGAGVMVWLVNHFTFVQNMLPEVFRNAPLMAALF